MAGMWTPLLVLGLLAMAGNVAVVRGDGPGPWKTAHATFYGERDGSGATDGACGYKDTVADGYGLQTAAVSTALFNNGATCGACFEIKCTEQRPGWCKAGAGSVTVTATNLCPPSDKPSDAGGWCNVPREHFDMSMPAFLQIGEEKAGIIGVDYRRVPCTKQGGIRYKITGNKYYNSILVSDVGGAGDVVGVEVKGARNPNWSPLKRDWGQMWRTDQDLTGEALTFRVTTSDQKKTVTTNALPQGWQFGKTYEAAENF